MTAAESQIPEVHEAALLAAYDEALAAGQAPSLDEQALSALGTDTAELRADLACLELLAQRWPRGRAPQENGISIHLDGPGRLTQLGRFRLLCELGRGGHGIVYLAIDPALGRQVALKVPRPEVLLTPDLRQRFLREASTAAGLDHPGLVPIYEAGEEGAVCYIASAYCPGRSLAAWLREQGAPMEPRTAARLVATAAEAVHYMHIRGVLHRDLKPANILLQADGPLEEADRTAPYPENAPAIPDPRLSPARPSLGTPKITDFGLAKQMDAADPGQTQTGAVLGTPAYMAPEQAAGRTRDISTATDIYALGAILYECLTGRPPFGGASDQPLLERVLAEEPTPPRRLRPGLPRDLETVCLKCLHKEPRQRYASAQALAEDLNAWLGHSPIAARPATTLERLAKWVRRQPSAAALVVVSTLAVLVALVGAFWHNFTLNDTLQQREEALGESNRLRKEGLARESRLRDYLYVTDMRLAREMWDSGDMTHVQELLDRHQPGTDDRRGFEWYWLSASAHAEKARFQAHDGGLLCAAISPDDRFLVTGDHKGNVKVWDSATLKEVGALTGHTDEVQRIVFARDGRTLATCSKDRSIRLWNVATWKETACLTGTHQMTITSVAFSPDGSVLASCDRDHRLALWELSSGRLLRSWVGHTDVVHDVEFTPDGRTLLSVGKDNLVRSWNVADGREGTRYSSEKNDPLRLSLSPDGRIMATAGYSHLILLQNLSGPAAPVELICPHNVRSLAFSPQGAMLAAGGGDGFLSVWDLRPSSSDAPWRRAVRIGGGLVREVVFTRQGTTLLTATEEGTVTFWDVGRILGWEQITTTRTLVGDMAISPDGRLAVWGTYDGRVHLWDLSAQKLVWTNQLPNIPDVRFAPSGRAVAAVCYDTVRVFDTATGRTILDRNADSSRALLTHAAFSPSEDLLATSHLDGAISIWEYPSGKLHGRCQAHNTVCRRLDFSHDGQTLAVSSQDPWITLWDPRTLERKAVLRGHRTLVSPLVFTPDDHDLISACDEGDIKVWDPVSGTERQTFVRSGQPIGQLVLTPDGRTLASVGADTVKLWHVATGQEMVSGLSSAHRFMCVAFSPDGRTLLAGIKPAREGEPCPVLIFRGEVTGR